MNHTPHFATIDDRGTPMDGLLALLERGCTRLMKQGGGALSQEQIHAGGLEQDVRHKVITLAKRGVSLQEIARRCQCHYGTVVKHTRPLRGLAPVVGNGGGK
jgi:hypothetical protein